mgnify:CR=1 FL=1
MPAELDGLRLAFLSDFHVGSAHSRAMTRKAFEAIAADPPDIVLLGGDYFDNGNWQGNLNAFDDLAAFPHVAAVLGNHDHRHGSESVQTIASELRKRGARVLVNERTEFSIRGRNVAIAGVDDPYTHHDDLTAALRPNGSGPTTPLILLAHAPTIADTLPVGGAAIVLSGHTHGGQIRLSPAKRITPLDSAWYLDRVFGRPISRLQRGFHWERGAVFYVANGIGTTRLPVRLGAPPEILIVYLSAIPPHPDAPCDAVKRYVDVLG